MDLFNILISAIVLSMILTLLRFFHANNSYEKIMSFYFLFTQFILLFLSISHDKFHEVFDIIIILFLLKFVAILFLLFNRKKL
jgi:multisubunit Na+/H+ antiporter MnhF subunit